MYRSVQAHPDWHRFRRTRRMTDGMVVAGYLGHSPQDCTAGRVLLPHALVRCGCSRLSVVAGSRCLTGMIAGCRRPVVADTRRLAEWGCHTDRGRSTAHRRVLQVLLDAQMRNPDV
jgi:hypothetical protein